MKWKVEPTENGLRVPHRHNLFCDWDTALVAVAMKRGEPSACGALRIFAAQLGLADVFERFDRMRDGGRDARVRDPRSEMAAMMLRSVVSDDAQDAGGDEVTPRIFSAGLASAAKAQLRAILDCGQARELLVKAFFEAALVAEAQPGLIRGDVLESVAAAMSA